MKNVMKPLEAVNPPSVTVCYQDLCAKTTGFPAWVLLLVLLLALIAVGTLAYTQSK
jgi:hypothetical protein